MNKLIVLISALVFGLSSCKKAPQQIVNNNTTIIYVNDSTATGNDSNPVTPTLFYDSTAIAVEASDTAVGVTEIVGTIRELTPAELPYHTYGSNTVGCELAIEFTFYTNNSGVRLEADQSLEINFPNMAYVAKSYDIAEIAHGTDSGVRWWRLRGSVKVERNVNDTPLPLSVTLKDYFYFINNRSALIPVNVTSNGVMFLKKPTETKTL